MNNSSVNASTPAPASAAHATYTNSESFGSLILLVFIVSCSGIALGLLQGFHFPKIWKFPGYELKPIIKGIVIPPLVLMILIGCFVKNWIGDPIKPYPAAFTKYIRGFCLCILLIRGGLQVTFRGKGIVVIFLATLP
jgi:hypothetical protein